MEFAELQRQLVPYLYDYKLMASRCTASIDSFNAMVQKLPNGTVSQHGRESLAFIDNGADILGVAHLDATGIYPHFAHFQVGGPQGDEWVFSRWLDDRLGVFLLLDVLPMFAHFDMLLTTGEETGQTSAKFFKPPEGKKYRWMFEPDRMGDDCVHYQYNTQPLLAALRNAGFSGLSHGSFTDICRLEHLGVCGFNFGIGYHENHGDWSRANLSQTLAQSARFLRFYQANQFVEFPYTPKPVTATPAYGSGWPVGEDYSFDHRWDKAKFTYEQVIRCISTGELWQVEGAPHQWGKDIEPMYWCRRPLREDERTPNARYYAGSASKDLPESDMSADLSEADQANAKMLFPRWKPPAPKSEDTAPLQAALSEQAQTFEDLINVTDATKTKWSVLVHLCDRPISDPGCIRARRIYEDKYFSGVTIALKSHCDEAPTPWPGGEPVYSLHQAVYTPFGQGRIDALYPTVVRGDENHWWVRYAKPDRDGIYCHLEPSSTLSLVARLPQVVTDLKD